MASLAESAKLQIGLTTRYNPAYQKISYPNGDVSIKEGVCSDVIIRALRNDKGIDLQQLIHIDMKNNFAKYPKIWGLIPIAIIKGVV